MNRILVAASLALLVGTSSLVSAQAATVELKSYTMDAEADMRASEFIGQRIYATAEDVEGRTLSQTELAEFDDIGEVNDIILATDGSVKAVILGVGGFLGLGESDVTVDMSSLRIVPETDGEGSFLVVNANKDQLTSLAEQQKAEMAAAEPAVTDEVASTVENGTEMAAETGETVVEETGDAVADAGAAVVEETAEAVDATTEVVTETTQVDGTTVTTTVPGTEAEPVTEVAAVEREALVKPQVVAEGYIDVATTELTADDLAGKRVIDAEGQDIGEISDLVMAADGTSLDRIVLDVGGFLGLGERQIAVPADELQFTRNMAGDVRVYIQATQAQLEAQPEYVAQ